MMMSGVWVMRVIGGPIVGLIAGRVLGSVTVKLCQVVVVNCLDGFMLSVGGLYVFPEIGVVIECHATLFTHHILGLEMNFVNMLT